MVGTRLSSNSGEEAPICSHEGATCGTCSSGIGSQDYAVHCEYCSSWFHYYCAGFSDPTYQSFTKVLEANLVVFYCTPCRSEIALLREKLSLAESANPAPVIGESGVSPEARLDSVERKIDEISDTLKLLIHPESMDESGGSPPEAPTAPSFLSVASKGVVSTARVITVQDFHKVQEEDAQRRSLVVAGLPENGTDFEDISALVKYLDPSASVGEVFRMGRIGKASDGSPARPRLLKVHVPSSSVVKSVLGQARRLKDSESFKGVCVRRSMTVKEREHQAKLRAQCSELNAKETTDGVKCAIFGEKIKDCEKGEAGRLLGGTRDRDWSPPEVGNDLN